MDYLNFYFCGPCNMNWQDYDYSVSADNCPCCGSIISPYSYQHFDYDDDDD